MNYYEAAKIRKKGFADLMTDKLTSGQGVFSSVRSTLSDRSKARSMAFKEKFDPLNLAKVLTGGSNLAPAMLGRLLGRKSSDINYFAGKKEYTPRRESSYFNNYTPSSMSSGGSQKATRVLQKMLSFMEKSRTDDMQEQDTLDSFKEMNENMREDRHKEVVDVFIQATKAKRKAEKDMAKEAKKREREAKKAEKETSKDTGGKGAADAADAAKKAKDAADAADSAKKAKDTADAAKKAKDAADATKKAKDAADAADAAKKAKDTGDAAKKAKDTADATKKAKDAADAADAAKKAKDAADATKKAKDAAEVKRIKDAADAKRAADTAKKQESVPKNKSAEKVKETKSEAPTAAPAPATEAAKTAAKVIMGGSKGLVLAALVAAGYSTAAQANIMANVDKESGFKPRSEEMPKAEKIFSMFGPPGVPGGQPSGGKNKVRFETIQDAKNIVAAGPEAYFNKVYDGRMGNNVPGDGYKYRGRGFIQITGKDMYNRVGKLIGIDLVNNPDLANQPEIAAKIIPAFFKLKAKEKKIKEEDYSNINIVNETVGSADMKSRELRVQLSKSYSEQLNSMSTENADITKDLSQGSSAGGTVIIQNNNTTQAKTNIHRAPPQEQLNPTMRH